jgi:LysM repeat protein
MDRQQKQNVRMLFVLLVSAVLCGSATFVAIMLVMDRTSTPAIIPTSSPQVIIVANTPVALYPDPNKIVVMANESGAVAVVAPESAATASAIPGIPPDVQPTLIPTPLPATPIPLPSEVIFVGYVVQPEDSLYRITKKQNTSIDLMALYGISAENIIVGNPLSLPVANPAYCPGLLPYVVRDHETVSIIARRFGTSPDAIGAVNNLDANYLIKTTQVICIP